MTSLRRILITALVLGAAGWSGTAYADPSQACNDANDGDFDLTGTQPSTVTVTRTAAIGEVFTGTLSGGVTNSLLVLNGTTLFSGQTSGTASFTVNNTTLTLVFDLQGNGTMRLRCTPLPDDPGPDPDPDPDPTPPPGATPNPEATTRQITSLNPPLSGLPSPFDNPALPPSGGPILIFLTELTGPACPSSHVREAQIAELKDKIRQRRESRGYWQLKAISKEGEAESLEESLLAAGLTFNEPAVFRIVEQQDEAEREARQARAAMARLDAEIARLVEELLELERCQPGGGLTLNQYAATPNAYAANSPLAAFAPFSPAANAGGTQMLFDDGQSRVWTSGRVSVLGGGPSALAGAKGAISVGAGRRINEQLAIGGEIGLSGGRTRIGAADTDADFAAISALIATSHRLAENAQLNLGLAGGYAWNRIDIAGATGSFASGQIGAFATIIGRHEIEDVRIAPSATLSASHTRSTAYTLSDGTNVASTGVNQLAGSAALRVSKPIAVIERDLVLEPYFETRLGYGLGAAAGLSGLTGSLSVGIDGQRLDGLQFGLSGTLGGVATGVWSVGGRAHVGGSF